MSSGFHDVNAANNIAQKFMCLNISADSGYVVCLVCRAAER